MAPTMDGDGDQQPRGLGRSPRVTGFRSRSYYLPDELHFRLRDAWWATHTLEGGYDSISSAVASALEALVGELEQAHNEGRRFPPMPEGVRLPGPTAKGAARQAQAMRDLAQARRDEGTS